MNIFYSLDTHPSFWMTLGFILIGIAVVFDRKYYLGSLIEHMVFVALIATIWPTIQAAFLSNPIQMILLGVVLGCGLSILEITLLGNPPISGMNNLPFSVFFFQKRFYRLPFYLWMAFFEEIIWRVALQGYLFGNNREGILVTSLFFTIRHRENLPNHPRNFTVFFLFSLLLGITYSLSGSLWMAGGLHLSRNLAVQTYPYYRRIKSQLRYFARSE